VAGVLAVLAMSACSSAGNSPGAKSDGKVPAADGSGKTLTVWVMDGDYTDKTLTAVNKQFAKRTGAKVDVQVQSWDGISTKIATALATSTPPDVIDVGNTAIASYAATGGLLDLTAYKKDLAQGLTWLDGLASPATIDGDLYGVPGFAGARAVVYNKKIWADAGITEPPKTYAELTADLDKVKAANSSTPDFSAFYLPGQYWFAGIQFVWDAGGDIAKEEGGKWVSGLSTKDSIAGLNAFKEFQNDYSSVASRTLDTNDPNQSQIFADGKTSAIMYNSTTSILSANPALKDDLGTFPFPGISGKAQPVMLGGSDWAVPAKSKKADLALNWIKIAASPDIQNKYVYGVDGWIPNSTQGIKAAQTSIDKVKAGFFAAALNSKATPANPNWSTISGNKTINNLFGTVASGSKSVKDAASAYDQKANDVLNTK
jgi:N,N'-diacetylchitobiose transport system substrate-binding protein